MTELPAVVNRYDMGVYILPPVSFNNQYALPNKFFEFIQGRVGVAIGPSPEMAHLVRQFDCGIVAEDFSPRTLARELGKLDRDRVLHFKQRSHEAAVALCYERAAENLERIVGEVLEGGPAPA